MRKTILYIAMSLDGFIADQAGGIGWLEAAEENVESMDSYQALMKRVDTVVMGRNTYDQIVSECSPQRWIYDTLITYVCTHRPLPCNQKIIFTSQPTGELIRELKEKAGKDIWICGGAALVQELLKEDLIDCYILSILPVLLGTGIPLFPCSHPPHALRLKGMRSVGALLEVTYERQREIL